MSDLPHDLHILACMNRKRDQYRRQGRTAEAHAIEVCMCIVWDNRQDPDETRPDFVDTVPDTGLGDL